MKSILRYSIMILCFPLIPSYQQPTPSNDDYVYDNEDYNHNIMVDESETSTNSSDKGAYVGSTCETSCSPKLQHVHCNHQTGMCECEKNYPVTLNPSTGCGKPKRLGEQCYYGEACRHSDQHAECVQIHHNAICQCKHGYHLVSMKKPSKRIFCAENVDVMQTDFSTLAGVLSGIALLSGLICFVLRLFNQNKYTRPHRYANAGLAPPIFFTNDPGIGLPIPMMLDQTTSMRATSQRSLSSVTSRRASSIHGCRGFSRTGSRRPSLTSIHSASSVQSYSSRRFEREREQKDERELQRRFAKMTADANERYVPTPSPKSTDDLLTPLIEDGQVPLASDGEGAIGNSSVIFNNELPSTSRQNP